MSSVVSSEAKDFFYLKLRQWNDTTENIPCEVELNETVALIETPDKYNMAVLSFAASLGASDLIFREGNAKSKNDINIQYEQRYLNLQEDMPGSTTWVNIERQGLALTEDSYSVMDVFSQLNPTKHAKGAIGAGFSCSADGSVTLSYPYSEKERLKALELGSTYKIKH